MDAHLTTESKNKKTGDIAVSITHPASCPKACGLNGVCYAKFGPQMIHWKHLAEGKIGIPWSDFCKQITALPPETKIWRHNAAGDLPGQNDKLNRRECLMLARANCARGYNRGGFTYTHYPVLGDSKTAQHNRKVISEMLALGFCVNLSADNLDMADKLAALKLAPVAVVLPAHGTNCISPAGNRVLVCLKVTMGKHCQECKLCQHAGRNYLIGLPAHGVKTKAASAIARGN